MRGEVLHCRGELLQTLAMMQQIAQMAPQHSVCHYALWALQQQSEILIAQGYLQTAWDTQEQTFRLIAQEGLEQLPMHEFLLRIRAHLLLSCANLGKAEKSARAGLKVLENFHPQQQPLSQRLDNQSR